MAKVLVIDYEKCTGCRLCEQVCSVKHEGVVNPARSRIKVIKWESAPCQAICPVKAISRDESLNRAVVDYDTCIGCRMCVAICPFGAMTFDALAQKVIKCDFCDGDPLCAKFCDVKAIRYADASVQSIDKQVAVADKFTGILQKAAAAMATV